MSYTRGRSVWGPIVFLVVALLLASIPVSAAGNPHVTGGGTFEEEGEKSTISFNAVQTQSGVTGHLVYHYRTWDITLWVDINCLLFDDDDDDTATLGGVITKVKGELPPGFLPPDFPPDLVGYVARVTVVDNGEGSAAEQPDQLSPVTIWWPPPDPNVCVFGPVEGEKIPLSGNIQVQK